MTQSSAFVSHARPHLDYIVPYEISLHLSPTVFPYRPKFRNLSIKDTFFSVAASSSRGNASGLWRWNLWRRLRFCPRGDTRTGRCFKSAGSDCPVFREIGSEPGVTRLVTRRWASSSVEQLWGQSC